MATAAEIRQLLSATSLPSDLVDKLVTDAPAVWLVGEQASVLAGDLALCHPELTGQCIVQVDAPDRVGLLWAVAAWFAANGVNVEAASAVRRGKRARGTFLVTGEVDSSALLGALSGTGASAGSGRSRPLRM